MVSDAAQASLVNSPAHPAVLRVADFSLISPSPKKRCDLTSQRGKANLLRLISAPAQPGSPVPPVSWIERSVGKELATTCGGSETRQSPKIRLKLVGCIVSPKALRIGTPHAPAHEKRRPDRPDASISATRSLKRHLPEEPVQTAGKQRCYRQRKNPRRRDIANRRNLQPALIGSHRSCNA